MLYLNTGVNVHTARLFDICNHWRKEQDPDLYLSGMGPRFRIRNAKMLQFRNTDPERNNHILLNFSSVRFSYLAAFPPSILIRMKSSISVLLWQQRPENCLAKRKLATYSVLRITCLSKKDFMLLLVHTINIHRRFADATFKNVP